MKAQWDERTLREALALRMGTDPGELVLDAIAGGMRIEVEMTDGGFRVLQTPDEVADFLTCAEGRR